MQNLFDQMGPRDDAIAATNAERWMDLIIEDSTPPEGAMLLSEYALALAHLKELVLVHIDAALADISGRPETGKAIRDIGYAFDPSPDVPTHDEALDEALAQIDEHGLFPDAVEEGLVTPEDIARESRNDDMAAWLGVKR